MFHLLNFNLKQWTIRIFGLQTQPVLFGDDKRGLSVCCCCSLQTILETQCATREALEGNNSATHKQPLERSEQRMILWELGPVEVRQDSRQLPLLVQRAIPHRLAWLALVTLPKPAQIFSINLSQITCTVETPRKCTTHGSVICQSATPLCHRSTHLISRSLSTQQAAVWTRPFARWSTTILTIIIYDRLQSNRLMYRATTSLVQAIFILATRHLVHVATWSCSVCIPGLTPQYCQCINISAGKCKQSLFCCVRQRQATTIDSQCENNCDYSWWL